MIKFKDNRNGSIKEAYDIEFKDNKVFIKFSEKGKSYGYSISNIEILDNDKDKKLLVYSFKHNCYKCKRDTNILTYITFKDGSSLVYPWDKNRLNNEKTWDDVLNHIVYEEIEFYPIYIIGSNRQYDSLLVEKYKGKIKYGNSIKLSKSSAVIICEHCGARQNRNSLNKEIDNKIQRMEEIKVFDKISLE